jgi:transcriptional regulator with XRE-family HTH domain
MEINTINEMMVSQVLLNLAKRVKQRRLELNYTQKDFAKRAGMGYDAYRRFENTGEISLRNLVLCATILDETPAFNELFSQQKYRSIEEVITQKKEIKRQRASKK